MNESMNDRTLIAPRSCQSEKSRNRMIWHAFRGVNVSGSETGMILRYCLLAQDGGKHVCEDETTTTMTLCIAEEKSSIPEIVNTHTNLANRMVDDPDHPVCLLVYFQKRICPAAFTFGGS